MAGQITELFWSLPAMVMQGITPEELMQVIVGDAEEPAGPLGGSPFDIAGEGAGSELSTFEQILADTGNIAVATGAAKVEAIQAVYNQQIEDKEANDEKRLLAAANAFIETQKDAEELLAGLDPTLGMTPGGVALNAWEQTPDTTIMERFSDTFAVDNKALVDTINELEVEEAKWEGYSSGVGLEASVYDQLGMGVGTDSTAFQNQMVNLMAEEASTTAPQTGVEALMNITPGTVPETELINAIAEYDLYAKEQVDPADVESLTLSARQKRKDAEKLLWDKLPQITAQWDREEQTSFLGGYEDPEEAISALLAALQKEFIDYGTYPGLDIDHYKTLIGAIVGSEIAQDTEWGVTPVEAVITQWATASPTPMAFRSGDLTYLLNNSDIKNWFDQAVEQGFSVPMSGTGKKLFSSGIRGQEIQAEAEWWTSLPTLVQSYLMGAVSAAREGGPAVDPKAIDVTAAFEITDVMQNWITNTVAFTLKFEGYGDPGTIEMQDWAKNLDYIALGAIQAEVQSQIIEAQQAREYDPTAAAAAAAADAADAAAPAAGAPAQTTLDQIMQLGEVMDTAPDVSLEGYEFIGNPTMQDGVTVVNLWYDPKGKNVYAERVDETGIKIWSNLRAARLSQQADNKFNLEIGPEGSGYFFTAYSSSTPRSWFVGDQTGADDTSTGLSALLGISPTDVASTFRGRPGALWEAARTAQLGPKAHIPQYWKTRMHGFTPAWGRHMMGSSPNESFATYLGRTADQDPNQTAADWGLAVQASRALGTPNSYLSVGATDTERIRAHQMQGLMRKGKAEVLAMASAGLGIDPDTYGGNAAYTRLSNMYDIFGQQEAGKAGDPGKFLSWIDDLMSGQAATTTGGEPPLEFPMTTAP
jgi:hypothetical protein